MCVGVLGVAAGVGALQLKDKRLEVEDFSDSVASWIAESVRAEYPNLVEPAEARMKSDFSAFLHEICVTNALARDRRKELLDSIPHFLPDYVYRGGTEVDGRAASRIDQFGRRRADMRLEDDLLSLKWALWRALTKPQLSLSEKEQLSQQRKFLVEYFEARDALFSTLKDLEYLMGTLTHQSRLEHLSWFRLRERLLLERSFRDPLDSVFDLPLPPEKFTEVMLLLQRVLERARTEDDPMAIFQLPSVRQVASVIKHARYTPSPLVSEFFLPFDSEKKVLNLDGPRSWDDPIHLRMMFLSHHPEATTHYDSQMRFSVAPIVRKNLRLGISGGIAPWDEGSNSADYMLNSLMGPVSERPIFFHRGYGQSRDLLRELSFRVPLTYDEEKRLRALMRDPMIDSLDSLLASAMSNPDPKSRRAVDKVRAVHAWQHAVIAKYEKALALDWLSESDEAELGRLLVGLRNRSVDRIFAPRDRFQGFVARDAKTQTGILYARYHSIEPFSGTYEPNRVRTPEIYLGTLGFTGLDSFKILIQGELTPALIGRFESGDDQALVLRIAESGDAVDSGTAIQFRRDEAIRFTFSEREYEFTYVSTWGRLKDSATAAPEVVFLRLAYFPQASE